MGSIFNPRSSSHLKADSHLAPNPMIFQLVLLCSVFASPLRADTPYIGKVVGVHDGDTITVLHDGKGERVRFYGIDAPEKKQAYGTKAKEHLSAMVFGKTVIIRVITIDRYGRTVGEVLLPDGKSANKEMVRAGFAWWYSRYAPTDKELKQLEFEARQQKQGLWADPRPEPPWLFRHPDRNSPTKVE